MQTVTPTKYNIGDVYRELHYIRSAGAGVVVSSLDPVDLSFPGPACRGYPTLRGVLALQGVARRRLSQQVNTVQFR